MKDTRAPAEWVWLESEHCGLGCSTKDQVLPEMLSVLLALLFPLTSRKLSSVAGSTALLWCETQVQVVVSTAGSFDDLSKFLHLCGLCLLRHRVGGWERQISDQSI